jgi:hypothetical protein
MPPVGGDRLASKRGKIVQLGDDQWKCDQGTSESISYREKSPLSKETK